MDYVHFLPEVVMDKKGNFLGSNDALLNHLNFDPPFKNTISGKTQTYMAVAKPKIMRVIINFSTLALRGECDVIFKSKKPAALAETEKKFNVSLCGRYSKTWEKC